MGQWLRGIRFLLLLSILFSSCDTKTPAEKLVERKNSPTLIPQPRSISIQSSVFEINSETKLVLHDEQAFLSSFINDAVFLEHNFRFDIIYGEEKNSGADYNVIKLVLDPELDMGVEAYEISINHESIELKAKTHTGLFWASQTLIQIIRQYAEKEADKFDVPAMEIRDEPSFKHRGMLLDVCRHFFDKEVLKKYIDLLAHYKMNVLHWHLTEDQGWRIQIDKYPKLTEISAWRTEKNGERYGGFYTKADIREIVAYAKERNISIIPEIELPGHSQAALSAYPEFSCKGKDIKVANDWGVFKEIYCAGNDSTFAFLENVLLEVMEMFPSKYIHIGGDEAPKFRWEHCEKCQRRIIEEGLTDEHELQSYFITRIEKFLNQHGRELIGWDEILEGGLSPNATVQSWRGIEHGITAAEANHKVIMSPTSHCYFDYGLKSIDLAKVYEFDPVPEKLDESKRKFIIGGECNMWTEHVPNEANLDSKVFPRILAMSEVLWTDPEERNFQSFYAKVQQQYEYLSLKNVNYGLEGEPVQLSSMEQEGKSYIDLKPGVPGLELKYKRSIDSNYSTYEAPLAINFSGPLKVKAFKNGETYGEDFHQEINKHKALASKVKYEKPYNEWYTAGGNQGLVDGLEASLDFRDGKWQGFFGNDMEVILDLKEKKEISDVWTRFYQYNNAWIFLPVRVEVYGSDDGESWVQLGKEVIEDRSEERGQFIHEVKILINPKARKRYLKFIAINYGQVPDWHEAAGSDCWIFIDEIVVK